MTNQKNENYSGPVRLQRQIPWGKRDRATGLAVCAAVRLATPPLVIPWHPHMARILRTLADDHMKAARLVDIFNLVDMQPMRAPPPPDTTALDMVQMREAIRTMQQMILLPVSQGEK